MRLGYLLMWAELEGLVCSGPLEGRRQTYALLDQRVASGVSLSTDEGLAELTRRYFTSRGPATLRDFVRWGNLTTAQGRLGLATVVGQLEQAEVGGRVYWSAPGGNAASPAPARIDLVQGYDEMVMSYGESRDVLLSALTDQPAATDRPPLLHAILLDGRLVGHWKHTLSRRGVMVDTFWHRPIRHDEGAAMDAAVARLGSFFESPARWR
jgi:hypothetical protein